MKPGLFAIMALVTILLGGAPPSRAEIEWDYVKPGSEPSIGHWFANILGVPGFERTYGVIVGISKFEHFNPLDATEDDPQRIFEFLRDDAGFDYLLVLRDEQVTYQRLRTLFEFELPHTLGENDRFLLFWSGHGAEFTDARGVTLGYLPLTPSPRDDKSTMVSMSDISRWDNDLPAKQALFLLDACFSGLAGTAAQSDDMDLEIRELSKPGHHIIAAGGRDQQTIASRQEWQGSIFTHALLKALSGDADRYGGGLGGGDGVINLYELVAHLGETIRHAKAAAGWNRPLRPILNVLRGEGQFFFLTRERKIAYMEARGFSPGNDMAFGMPVATLGPGETEPCDADAERRYWESIQYQTAPRFFEDYLSRVAVGEMCGLFADVARSKLQSVSTATPSPSLVAPLDEVWRVRELQEMLGALGFAPGPADGVAGLRTRAAIMNFQRSIGNTATGTLTQEDELALAGAYSRLVAPRDPVLAPSTREFDVIGLALMELDPRARQRFQVPADVTGVMITSVDAGSTAAGELLPGDVIVRIDSISPENPADVVNRVDEARARGRRILTVLIYRDGSMQFFRVNVGNQ